MNDLYIDWFLQVPFQIHPHAVGAVANIDRLESLFFGTHRYVLKRMLMKEKANIHIDESRHHSVMIRCSLLTTIIRNLSFIEENLFLANEYRLLDILERVLNFQHDLLHPYLSSDELCWQCTGIADVDDRSIDTSSSWSSPATEVRRSIISIELVFRFCLH